MRNTLSVRKGQGTAGHCLVFDHSLILNRACPLCSGSDRGAAVHRLRPISLE